MAKKPKHPKKLTKPLAPEEMPGGVDLSNVPGHLATALKSQELLTGQSQIEQDRLATPPPIRPEPPAPEGDEKKYLDMLWEEFEKADAAARAAARFEHDVHARLTEERLADGYTADQAGEHEQAFSAQEFCLHFKNLLELRVASRLIDDLGLGSVKQEILAHRIEDVLGASQKRQVVFYGDDEAYQHYQHQRKAAKEAARRRGE